MEYVTTTKFEDIFIPIYIDELDGAHALATNMFTHYHGLRSKFQIVLNKDLINEEDDFVKYVFNHELGHIHLYLKIERGEISLNDIGLLNHELFADVYSLRTIDKYNLDFINYLIKYEEDLSYQQSTLFKYMKMFIERNIYNDIYDILNINFTGIL